MYFDESSIFRTVRSCSHLFSNCSTLEDNLFTSVVINRGPFAAVSDALHYRWTISIPLIDSIRGVMEEMLSPGDEERVMSADIAAGRLVEFEGFTALLDRVATV